MSASESWEPVRATLAPGASAGATVQGWASSSLDRFELAFAFFPFLAEKRHNPASGIKVCPCSDFNFNSYVVHLITEDLFASDMISCPDAHLPGGAIPAHGQEPRFILGEASSGYTSARGYDDKRLGNAHLPELGDSVV